MSQHRKIEYVDTSNYTKDDWERLFSTENPDDRTVSYYKYQFSCEVFKADNATRFLKVHDPDTVRCDGHKFDDNTQFKVHRFPCGASQIVCVGPGQWNNYVLYLEDNSLKAKPYKRISVSDDDTVPDAPFNFDFGHNNQGKHVRLYRYNPPHKYLGFNQSDATPILYSENAANNISSPAEYQSMCFTLWQIKEQQVSSV